MNSNEQPKENKLLLQMLDIATDVMIENEMCSYCAAAGIGDCFFEKGTDLCKNKMFEGLKRMAQRSLKNESKTNDTTRAYSSLA